MSKADTVQPRPVPCGTERALAPAASTAGLAGVSATVCGRTDAPVSRFRKVRGRRAQDVRLPHRRVRPRYPATWSPAFHMPRERRHDGERFVITLISVRQVRSTIELLQAFDLLRYRQHTASTPDADISNPTSPVLKSRPGRPLPPA